MYAGIIECAGVHGSLDVPGNPRWAPDTMLVVDSIKAPTRPRAMAAFLNEQLPRLRVQLVPGSPSHVGLDDRGNDIVLIAGRKFQRSLIKIVQQAHPTATWAAGGTIAARNVMAYASVDGRTVGIVAGCL